ncbi:MAG: hypothetical protein IPJ65_10110 [Archangiaceae bacterium]|nr:hypothetical protein [Archangiaceae bacterium]
MKRIAVALLFLTACGREARELTLQGTGLPPPVPRLHAAPLSSEGLSFANLRRDGDLYAVDVVATGRLAGIYGLALRLELSGARWGRAQAARDWPLTRFEATRSGAVGVLSEQGAAAPRTLEPGPVATLWLELTPSQPARLALDPSHSAALNAEAAALPVELGSATVDWN